MLVILKQHQVAALEPKSVLMSVAIPKSRELVMKDTNVGKETKIKVSK